MNGFQLLSSSTEPLMSNRIASALAALFEKHRIVFWYDAKKELRADFEAVGLQGVTKLERCV